MKKLTKEEREAIEVFHKALYGLCYCCYNSRIPGEVIRRLSKEDKEKLKNLTAELIDDWQLYEHEEKK